MLNELKKPFYFLTSLLTVYLLTLSKTAFALDEPSLGQAAGNMLVPIGMFTDAFHKLCYIIGGVLILSSGIQYKNYRNNPSAVRLSTPVVLFLLGLALVLLPLIGMTSLGSVAASGNTY